jgi:peptide/nickel transport system substrate-binding protein
LAIAACLTLAACGGTAQQQGSANAPLVIDMAGGSPNPQSLDPAVDYDNDGYSYLPQLYDFLVRATGSTSVHVVPDLATSWSESPNGLTWTFHLRPNVKFHDGTTVNSRAVKFSFERLLTIKQGGWADFKEIRSVTTPSSMTVVFHLAYPYSPFLQSLSSAYGAEIVSPTVVLAHQVHGDLGQKWLYDHDAGSGPYDLVRWTHGQSIQLKKFPGYWGGWAGHHVSQVVLQYNTVSSTVRLGLQNGSIDAAQGLSPQDFSALQHGNGGVSVSTYIEGSVFKYIAFNTKWGPLRSPTVRVALAETLDTPAIAKYVFSGTATTMNSYAPKGTVGYVPAPEPYSYNLARARELLAQAGYAHGFTLPAIFFTGDNQGKLAEQLWQSDLAKLNIKLTLQAMPYTQFVAIQTNPKTSPPVVLQTWAEDYANSFGALYNLWLTSTSSPQSGNYAFYSNPTVDSLLAKARSTRTDAAALPLYSEMMGITYRDAPYLPVADLSSLIALGSNVHGYRYDLNYTQFYFPVYSMWVS